MKLILMFLFMIPSLSFAQTRDEMIKNFMEQRKQMMKQMIQMFQDDFSNDSFFNDDFDPFSGMGQMKSFNKQGNSVEIKEEYKKDGTIEYTVIPKDKNMTLDIQTTDSSITIKTETKVEQVDEQNGNQVKSYSSSSSSQIINAPEGYTVKKPENSSDGVKITLVPTGKVQKVINAPKIDKKKKLMPIGKMPGEETI